MDGLLSEAAVERSSAVEHWVLRGRLPVRLALHGIRALRGSSPVPLRLIRGLRALSSSPEALLPPSRSYLDSGNALNNEVLKSEFREQPLGLWSMSASTLNVVEAYVRRERPSSVIELGSGVSTACLARFLRECHGAASRPRLFSLEQDARAAESTDALLSRLGLRDVARVFVAPLTAQVIEGRSVRCYAVPEELRTAGKAAMVLVDGPSGEAGIRFGTLPLLRPYAESRCRILADDALRDSEIDVAERWSRLPFVQISGIHLTGKGLLAGRFK